MEIILAAIIVAAAVVGVGVWIRQSLQRPDETRASGDDAAMTLLQNQMNVQMQQTREQMDRLQQNLAESMQQMSGQMTSQLSNANKTVGERLDNTSKVIGDVRQQLGKLEESSGRIAELGRDISGLQEILQPPKLRGGLGELFLNELLAQILPPSAYETQHGFKGGETVDAVVVLKNGMVPIDAKFPLESFRRLLKAEDDAVRTAEKKAFIKDVKVHIDAIASKYIRMDEGTLDFALMYIPAENVYYETIIKDSEFGDEQTLFNYAASRRVIPVSPNNLYAYLQTILLGLKGMQVERSARDVIENLARVRKEFERFSDAFRLVGKHLDSAQKKYFEAEKRQGKVEAKMEAIDGVSAALEEEPGATEPAALSSGLES